MTAASLKKPILFVGLLLLLLFSQIRLERSYTPPFPHFDALLTKTSGIQDAAFITFGFRRLAADVAWVQLLQNMGSYDGVKSSKNYPYLKNDTLRVTRIDPYFHRAYLFGAATLAWLRSTNRPDEALEVLAEGIHYNPTYWAFRTYAAGIGYMRTNQMQNMIRMLEDALRDPNCPTIVKSVLANSYKFQKRYLEAIAIWEDVLSSDKGREYHGHAREEIPRLIQLIRSSR